MVTSTIRKRRFFVTIMTASTLGGFAVPASALAQDGAATGGNQPIIVTATRRASDIQDVPIAVTAIGSQDLDRVGARDIVNLISLSPSLSFHYSQTESQGTTIRLRGIGTTGNNIGLESAVGVFLDGIYLSRPSVALGDLVDVEQVEILRGPQGTLFGRNTSAGAITITTRAPNLSDVDFFSNLTYGNFDGYSLQAGVGAPLVRDQVGIRLSAALRGQDGFVTSTTGAESHTRDRYLVRGQLLWEPSNDVSLRLIADFSDTDEECCDAPIILDPLNGSGAFDAAGLPSNGGVAAFGVNAYEDRLSNGGQFRNPMQQWGISGELNWDLGFADLTLITGYRHFRAPTFQDVDFVSLDVVSSSDDFESFDEIDTFTQEIRLHGVSGPLDWLIGGYYSNEDIRETLSYEAGADYSRYITASAWYGLFFAPGGVYSSLSPADQAALNATVLPAGTTPTFGNITAAAAAPPQDLALLFAGGTPSTGFFGVNNFRQEGESWSLFTHNTLEVTDALSLTLGARWTHESKDGSYRQTSSGNAGSCFNAQANAFAVASAGGAGYSSPAVDAFMGQIAIGLGQLACFPFFAPVDPTNPFLPQEFSSSFTDEEFIYTAALSYEISPLANIYASLTHGFKAGGFNLDPTAASLGSDPRFNSETTDSYEIGLKIQNDFLRLNIAAFMMDVHDFQVLDFNGVQFRTFNVPRVNSDGVEVEFTATPTDFLSLNGAVTYADTSYPDNCAAGLSPAPVAVTTLCGSQLMNAPKWTVVLGATLEGDLSSNLHGFATVSGRYESQRRTGTRAVEVSDLSLLPFDVQGENAKINARIGIGNPDAHWMLEAWVNNLTNEQTRVVTFNVPLRGLGLAHTAARGTFIEPPRTYGLTLRLNF